MSRPLKPLLQAADFERVLKAPQKARSPHFAVHHLVARPVARARTPSSAPVPELSTANAPLSGSSVDNLSGLPPDACWLGTVVPKRHAKRAVTRNLLKRQMRAAVARHQADLPAGLWVLRLRTGFDLREFPSAASPALRQAVRDELDALLRRARPR